MRITRLLPTLTATALVATLAAGCGGGGGDEQPKRQAATPAPAPEGFVVERGPGWSVSRPRDWKPIDTGMDKAGESYTGFESAPGTNGVPSQVGVGVDRSPETKDLGKAVEVARDINKVRYQGYHVDRVQDVEVSGGTARRIDATYDAFIEQKMQVRIVEVLVQLRNGRQLSLLVRGPAPDFDRLGLDRIVSSFRVA